MTTPLESYPYNLHKHGVNPSVGTPPQDIIAASDVQYFPSAIVAAGDIDISSSSDEDAPDQTGAYAITIDGITTNQVRVLESVILNGTTAVNPVHDYWFINQVYVTAVGSAGTNVGAITIEDASGTLASILAGKGKEQQCTYFVPSDSTGCTLVGAGIWLSASSLAHVIAEIQISIPGEAWRTHMSLSATNTTPNNFIFDSFPIRISPKSRVRLRIDHISLPNQKVGGYLNLWVDKFRGSDF